MKKKFNFSVNYIYLFLTILLIIFIYYLYRRNNNNIEKFSLNDELFLKVLKKNDLYVKNDNNQYIIYKKNNLEDDLEDDTEIISYNNLKFNSEDIHYIAKNKNLTSKIYSNNDIPVPKYFLITKDNIDNFYKEQKISYPCVLKPTDQSYGRDVFTNIQNKEQFINILDQLISKYDNIMYEEQVYGTNYRIFIFHNKVIDIIEKQQPYVIGNGIDTIETLIDDINNEKIKNKLFKTTMKESDWEYIKTQGDYNKDTILEEGEKVFITLVLNLRNGAVPKRIPLSEVPDENIKLFEKTCRVLNAIVGGIDYISEDIRVPYYVNNGAILELNSHPGIISHQIADQTDKYFLYNKITDFFI
jgi:glutathione synthase/RimK-type ligase-like ATP-grasp enzyme